MPTLHQIIAAPRWRAVVRIAIVVLLVVGTAYLTWLLPKKRAMAMLEDCVVEHLRFAGTAEGSAEVVDAVWQCVVDSGCSEYFSKADVAAFLNGRSVTPRP